MSEKREHDFECIIESFEQAWRAGSTPSIETLVAGDRQASPSDWEASRALILELIKIDMEYRWRHHASATTVVGPEETQTAEQAGGASMSSGPRRLDDYLRLFPRLADDRQLPELICEEFRARLRWGDRPAAEDFAEAYGDLGHRALSQLRGIAAELAVEEERTSQADATVPDEFRSSAVRIPDYEILEEIGSGAMGVVYRARQTSADRVVAVKIIRAEHLRGAKAADSESALQRFQVETRALARLQHENIISVYEVGAASGSPYFSMQYVAGESFARLLQRGPVACRVAARYMEAVCRAVAGAHRHGILHRDLKPQNILLEKLSDRPLVADFGLAKFHESADELTRQGDVVGTPQYMSPEQARDSASVTVQADVYALGATLYHLLTGRPPFQAATALETLHQVLHDEPVAPRALNPHVDRDLNTICRKCLEKTPRQRYASAAELGDEFQRYLSGRPIHARPVGWPERTRRWCLRNPALASLSAVVALSLCLTLAAFVTLYVQEVSRKRLAAQAFADAQYAFDRVVDQIRGEPRLEDPELRPIREKLLKQALEYYRAFLAKRATQGSLRREVAATYAKIGLISEEIVSPQEALQAYQKALALYQQEWSSRPGETTILHDLGNTWNSIGRVQTRLGALREAAAAFGSAIAVREKCVESASGSDAALLQWKRQVCNSRMNLGIVKIHGGEPDEAAELYAGAQQMRQELLQEFPHSTALHRDFADGFINMGNLCLDRQQSDEARKAFARAEGILQQLAGKNPFDTGLQFRLATTAKAVGNETQDLPQRIACYERALHVMDTLVRDHPAVHRYREELASICLNQGQTEFLLGRDEVAAEHLERAQQIFEERRRLAPDSEQLRRDLATTLFARGKLHRALGRTAEAEGLLQQAESLLVALVQESDDAQDRATLDDIRAARSGQE